MTMTTFATGPLTEAVSQPSAADGPRRTIALPNRIQFSYTTRFVSEKVAAERANFHLIAGEEVRPRPGDVVIAKVSHIEKHKRIETEYSRKAILFPDTIVAVAYGDRYAADQFLAHVPESLEACHLVAAGGVAGTVTEMHTDIIGPTEITPLGLLADSSGVVNLLANAPHANVPVSTSPTNRPQVVAVLGTSMNSGKSTVMSCVVNGLTSAGYRVGAGKITGTGAGNDRMHYFDAGANEVIDFTDFGYSTTFKLDFDVIRALSVNMVGTLSTDNDIIVVEIADGIYQEETARLLRDPLFQKSIDSVMFAAVDALGTKAGTDALIDAGLTVTCASGVMTSSPLATREATAILAPANIEVVDTFELCDANTARRLVAAR